MKRFLKSSLSIFLALTIIFSSAYVGLGEIDFRTLFAVEAKAASSGTCGENITWTLDNEGLLTVSGTGDMTEFLVPDSRWAYIRNSVKSVIIESGVTRIAGLFSCTNLTSVTIPDTVTYIDGNAFYACKSLTSVIIPYGVEEISGGAFQDCTSLTSITIPDSVTSIRRDAFSGCTRLTSVTISENISYISYCAFYGCKSLVSVTIPENVTDIDINAFRNCTNLTSIVIPDSVTSIGNFAFEGCHELKYVFYKGSKSAWAKIEVDTYNQQLTSAVIHYNATDHTYAEEWTIVLEPTCTEEGSKSRQCIYCEKTDTIPIEPNFHDYSTEWTIDVAPTCTEEGIKSHHCTVCGDKTDELPIPATGHSYGAWEVDVEPNCTEEGSKHKTCSSCGDVITEAIDPNGHDYSEEWTTDVEPDCTEEGSKSHHCIVCGDKSDITVVEPNGHDYSEDWTIDIEPTCTEKGSKSHHCTVCGDKTDITEIEENGHTYGDWIIDIEPNCTEEGSKHKVCSVCGDVATEAIDPNGHDYSEEWTIDVEPDCTEEGSKSHHCIVCGDKTDITVIEPNGHNYSEDWTIDVEPTHNSLGSKSHHCVACGDKTDITSIPALRINVDGFVYSEITEDICNITGYNKKTSTVIIPNEINGFKVKSIYQGTFKSNTDIVSVTISNGVSEIGSLAFYNCSNLKEIIIPSSVTKFASRAIYSCKDVTIKCISGSAAHTFAVGNNIAFELIDITPDFGTYVDYENKYIFTDKYCTMNTIDFLFMDTVNFDATALPSQILAGKDYFGTGAQLFMFGENVDNEYTVIVKGDLNGDSVCDVLDAAVAQRYSAGFDEPTENEVYAANGCVSDEIDVISYQNVVNMALAS